MFVRHSKQRRALENQIKHKANIMYTSINFKTKKALKDALAAGEQVQVFQPNDMFGTPTANLSVALEGPHYPQPHRWYATATTNAESCIVPGTVK